jgi:hypothetical protein
MTMTLAADGLLRAAGVEVWCAASCCFSLVGFAVGRLLGLPFCNDHFCDASRRLRLEAAL